MVYSFTCPLEGCTEKMTVEAGGSEEAADKLTAIAKGHLANVHPEIVKTDEEIKNDIMPMMVVENPEETS